MKNIDILNKVLKNSIQSLNNIEILNEHVHDRAECPHFNLLLEINTDQPTDIYPIRDSRYNNLLEKIKIVKYSNNLLKLEVQVNIQTIKRSSELID